MSMKRIFRLILATQIILTGCATAPEKMGEAHVSYFKYADFTCSQLASEADDLDQRIPHLYSQLKKTSDDEEAQMSIALILFWPVLFYLEYRAETQAVEYSQLLGERDAISRIAMKKDCANRKSTSTLRPMKNLSLRS